MPEPLAYLNGRFLPASEAHLPLHDAGFIFGATVTDLCRTFRHRLYRLNDHLTRFRYSCQLAHVPQPLADEELRRIAEKLVSNNAQLLQPNQDLALVMFATPGPIGYYVGLEGGLGDGPPTLCMHTFPLPFARYRGFFREGVHLAIPPTPHFSSSSVDPRIKQRSRMHWWLADREVHALSPSAIALLLDANNHVTETAAANFLIVRNGTVLSPPRSSILGGISLQTVEELCHQLAIPFAETDLSPADCLAADEAMLSSTPYCLAPVSRVNDSAISWPGPILERLVAAWSQQVGLDIRQQILASR
jgi:branched-subunit amino acid aminotransferase/4-amino-4-deoxychorismate lyase